MKEPPPTLANTSSARAIDPSGMSESRTCGDVPGRTGPTSTTLVDVVVGSGSSSFSGGVGSDVVVAFGSSFFSGGVGSGSDVVVGSGSSPSSGGAGSDVEGPFDAPTMELPLLSAGEGGSEPAEDTVMFCSDTDDDTVASEGIPESAIVLITARTAKRNITAPARGGSAV